MTCVAKLRRVFQQSAKDRFQFARRTADNLWYYAATRDLIGLMELGGWGDERMVRRYAHMNVSHLAASIAALPWRKGGELGKANAG
jgi:hypothetical protein